MDEKIFKAYDVRGTYPDQINEDAVKAIAQAYATFVKPKTVAVGRDVRLSSPSLQQAVIEGLVESGVNIVDIGQVPTELLYFAVGAHKLDGGIQVSASHNPAEFNGLKMVRGSVEAISSDNGLKEIKELALAGNFSVSETSGQTTKQNLTDEYLQFLEKNFIVSGLPKVKIVANNNFGLSGILAEKLLGDKVEFVGLNSTPDGSFPKGRPDPLIPDNSRETSSLVTAEAANFGVAWDADGDRCFFVDERGQFVESCYVIALFVTQLLSENPGQKIIYDPRNTWAIEDAINNAGGQAILNKAGHTFIKNRMRSEEALFAGEASGHYYFKDFFYADNGIIPLLLMLKILSAGQTLSQIIQPLKDRFPVSGQVDFQVSNSNEALLAVRSRYQDGSLDETDGLSISYPDWRFNLRPSNTEPLLRLNVEGRSKEIVQEKTAELQALLSN